MYIKHDKQLFLSHLHLSLCLYLTIKIIYFCYASTGYFLKKIYIHGKSVLCVTHIFAAVKE